jgi:hypothetical protein
MSIQGVAPFSFLTYDVLSWVPDGILSRSGQWTTPRERLDVPSGAFAFVAPGLHPVHSQKAVFRCLARADHAPLWTWLTAQLGRYNKFWCPSFMRDLEVLSTDGPTGSGGHWTIRDTGYAALFAADPTVKYLYGYRKGGADVATMTVTAAVNNGDGTETLTYDTGTGPGSFGAAMDTLATANAACLLRLSRLDDDTLVSTFASTELCDVAVAFASITGEQP